MSYPRDLEDYADEELIHELARRQGMRKKGQCSRCGRPLLASRSQQGDRCARHEVYVGEYNGVIIVERA